MDEQPVLLLGQTHDARAFAILYWFFAAFFMVWGSGCVLAPGLTTPTRLFGLVFILIAVMLGRFARRWTRCGVYLLGTSVVIRKALHSESIPLADIVEVGPEPGRNRLRFYVRTEHRRVSARWLMYLKDEQPREAAVAIREAARAQEPTHLIEIPSTTEEQWSEQLVGRSRTQTVAWLVPVFCNLILFLVWFTRPNAVPYVGLLAAIWAVGSVGNRFRTCGARAGAKVLTISGFRHVHRVPWSEVHAIAVSRPGVGGEVTISLADGRPLPIRATGIDAEELAANIRAAAAKALAGSSS